MFLETYFFIFTDFVIYISSDNIIYKMYFFFLNRGTCNINGIFLTYKINITYFILLEHLECTCLNETETVTKRLSRNLPV